MKVVKITTAFHANKNQIFTDDADDLLNVIAEEKLTQNQQNLSTKNQKQVREYGLDNIPEEQVEDSNFWINL
jgi:hypothetical protein